MKKNKWDDNPISNRLVKDIMSGKNITIRKDYTIKSTIETLKSHKLSGVPVTDENKKLIGFISEYDLLLQAASRPLSDKIEYCSKKIFVSTHNTLKEVLVLMFTQRLKVVTILNHQEQVVGSLSRIEVLSALIEN